MAVYCKIDLNTDILLRIELASLVNQKTNYETKMLQPKVTPWCVGKGVPLWLHSEIKRAEGAHMPRLDAVLNGHDGDMARTWCESILNPTYHNLFPKDVVTTFEWCGIPVRGGLVTHAMQEQIWRWYRERGCSDAVVELVFMINTYPTKSFKYYIKHICEYICGGKWMVQRTPCCKKDRDRLESCATTIRNELYEVMKNDAAKEQMGLFDDWRIQHVPMQLVELPPNCQGKQVDIVDERHNVVTPTPPCHVKSTQRRRGGYTPC